MDIVCVGFGGCCLRLGCCLVCLVVLMVDLVFLY